METSNDEVNAIKNTLRPVLQKKVLETVNKVVVVVKQYGADSSQYHQAEEAYQHAAGMLAGYDLARMDD